jgi:hypothetical protein
MTLPIVFAILAVLGWTMIPQGAPGREDDLELLEAPARGNGSVQDTILSADHQR